MRSVRSVLLALSFAGTAVLMTSITAYAAMDATLSSAHARPGDWILLLTDDHTGTWNYQALSAEGNQPIYLTPVNGDFAAGCASQSVGRLQWKGNRGGVAFTVPNLTFGDYYLFMKTSSQCWRLADVTGSTHALLVLTIGNLPADNQTIAASWTVNSLGPHGQGALDLSSDPPWLSIIGASVAVIALLWFGLWKRRRRVHSSAIGR